MSEIELSKYLSFVLRHKPESIGLVLNSQGYADILDLISLSEKAGKHFSLEELENVVANNDKKRFTVINGINMIRASQGHSTNQVNIKMSAVIPPAMLYHGTALQFVASIRKEGLKPMKRHHVHLSQDKQVAMSVGIRHGTDVVILEIKAEEMHNRGYKFYMSDNKVWLTDNIPSTFIL